MKLICVSDLHGYPPKITRCDLVIIAGDICPVWNHDLHFQQNWLESDFKWWLRDIKQRTNCIVGIAGNHDLIFERQPDSVPNSLDWIYLKDSGTQFENLRIYGAPWQPYFNNWSFNLYEPDLEKKWDLIPEDTDILVVHGPPYGYGDLLSNGQRVGSPSLTNRIAKLNKLKLVVTGHIHQDYGVHNFRVGDKVIPIANASVLNEQYELVNEPLRFEVIDETIKRL